MVSPARLPRLPCVGLALAAMLGIQLADSAPFRFEANLIALGLLAGLALLTKRSLATYAFVCGAFFFLHGLQRADSAGKRLAELLGDDPRALVLRGAVVSEPKISALGTASFLLRLESIELDHISRRTTATVLAHWKHAAEFGDELNLFGTAKPIEPTRNPGEFDLREFLRRNDVTREFFVGYPENGVVLRRGGGNPFLRAAQKSRNWMQATLTRGLGDSPDVESSVSGMVLGLRHQTPDDIEEPFQQTGTLHLFAVAGLHVGIVARLLWMLCTVARLPRKWSIALIIPALFFYAAITGLHVSSLRAAIMSAALLGGFFFERKLSPLNGLAAAALAILCWKTNEFFSVGFRLSFCVVTAIILIANPADRFLRRCFAGDPFLPRVLYSRTRRGGETILIWIARGASVSFAAWIGSIPLMLNYYYLITPISILANLTVVPIAFFVLATALLSLLAAPFSHALSIIFNNSIWALTKLILILVHLFAQLPAGHIYLEQLHWPTGARAEITVLDLGTGGAIHLRAAGRDWLIDTGSRRNFERTVEGYLRSRGVNRLDRLILTHGDAGHLGGGISALQIFRPRDVDDSNAHDRSRSHKELIDFCARKNLTRSFWAAGDEIKISDDLTARILFPPRDFETTAADDEAIVLRLEIAKGPRVLLMSDSGVATEDWLMKSGADLRADLIIKGQHHSSESGSAEFLEVVRPAAIIATSRDFPKSERIKDEWAAMLGARGIKLFRQDNTGAVRVLLFRNRWEARTYLRPEIFRSTR